jgi:hypothetical protein
MRDAYILGLGPVNLISEDPTTGFTLRWHFPAAIITGPAAGDARNDYYLTDSEVRDIRT